jgi:hypothetical protein
LLEKKKKLLARKAKKLSRSPLGRWHHPWNEKDGEKHPTSLFYTGQCVDYRHSEVRAKATLGKQLRKTKVIVCGNVENLVKNDIKAASTLFRNRFHKFPSNLPRSYKMLLFKLILSSAAIAAALPTRETSEGNKSQPFSEIELAPWNAGAVNRFPIHSSCNATQRRQIELGLNETITLAEHAKDHILRWRNESEIYRKYFGDRPSMEAIGAFDVVVNGDKKNVLFRCDNPDGNCNIKSKVPCSV